MTANDAKIADALNELLPDARCALDFTTPFQCVVAVALSAQTTDKSVNEVTPALFSRFPDAKSMAEADVSEIENLIMRLGLYKNKAKNLSLLAKKVVEDFGGEIPNSREALTSLPGVGIKTSNVVRAECFGVPAIAVDTHVARVSYRLGYCKEGEDPVKIESILERRFPKEKWIKLHHQIIWFGRLVCHARNPECDKCPLKEYCRYFKKVSSKTGK
jgi:endonuclease-3